MSTSTQLLALHIKAVALLQEILTQSPCIAGEGRATSSLTTPPSPSSSDDSQMDSSRLPADCSYVFAPRGLAQDQISLRSRIRERLHMPVKVRVTEGGPITKMREACAELVKARLSPAENGRFLEHFRYTIVASQLLSEHTGYSGAVLTANPNTPSKTQDFRSMASNSTGAFITATTAFALVWLIQWTRTGRPSGDISKSRATIAITTFVVVGTVLYSYAKRQYMKYQRENAVDKAQAFVTNLQAFNSSSNAALSFIQEVELVSRGYRISSPLPPITRLEERGQARRCARLRKSLRGAYEACIPPFLEACDALRIITPQEDFEKYLDVYDVNDQDLMEAHMGYSPTEFDDMDSLRILRVLQLRLSVLRREFLCSLLSVEANGTEEDLPRWKAAADSMTRLAALAGEYAERVNNILTEQELFVTTPTKRLSMTPERERLRSQVQKLGNLSSGIRGLQAKLQVLREESTKSLDQSDDISDLGGSLLLQYDTIGSDLKTLMHAWENGKQNLMTNIERNERRISQLSTTSSQASGLRSPAISLGGLTAVDESPAHSLHGSPSDALRALNGELPYKSVLEGHSPIVGIPEEEIFEAISIPKTRSSVMTLTREEKIARMMDSQARAQKAREQREAASNMILELEDVIKSRGTHVRRSIGGRILSM